MILWEQHEITKEIKKLKGTNYKGRDVGPFIRLCNICNTNTLEYKNFDNMRGSEKRNMPCKECNKNTKGKTGNFSKTCYNENCKNLIFYKSKYDMITGIDKNTECQDCNNNKLSKFYKEKGGFYFRKTKEQQKEIINQVAKSRQKYYEQNPEKLEQLQRKQSYNKWYMVGNLNCQGSAEKLYIETLIKQNRKLPTKGKLLSTSLGHYTPDFEFEEMFIEVKSTYTYELLKKENNKQYLKIREISSNIKPVQIIVIDCKTGCTLFTEILN